MTQAITFALEILKWLPAVKQGVVGAYEMFEWGRDRMKAMKVEGRAPTDAEWAELNAKTQALRDELHTD